MAKELVMIKFLTEVEKFDGSRWEGPIITSNSLEEAETHIEELYSGIKIKIVGVIQECNCHSSIQSNLSDKISEMDEENLKASKQERIRRGIETLVLVKSRSTPSGKVGDLIETKLNLFIDALVV